MIPVPDLLLLQLPAEDDPPHAELERPAVAGTFKVSAAADIDTTVGHVPDLINPHVRGVL